MQNKSKFTISALLLVIVAVIGVNAAGPLFIWNAEQRIPYRWDVTSPVKIYTDSGPFETNIPPQFTPIPNEIADAAVAFAAQQWTNVETSSFQAQVAGDFDSIALPDIVSGNAGLVFGPDNDGDGIHFVYDADGTIMQNFFGASPFGVLGIATPEWADEATGTITEGWVIINAKPRWSTDNDLQMYAGVFTHELGHAINLAHSQTNGAAWFSFDPVGPRSCTTVPYPTNVTVADVETMYPFINQRPGGSGAAQSTVERADDKAAISDLYPDGGYPNTKGSITGKVLQTDGKEGITGINVIARNLTNPYADAVSAMTGDYIRVQAGNDGTFTLNGLTPGASYALYTDMIVQGGFPTLQPLYVPEGEEFYNGANESGNGLTDDRCQAEPIAVVAGSAAEAEITLNSVKGAPPFIPLAPGTGARTISSDGRVVGGPIAGGGTFRWTEEGGYETLNLTQLAGGVMSRDGNAFASETWAPGGTRITHQASLLRYPGEWERLPLPVPDPPAITFPCDTTSHSWGIAANGKAVSGMVWLDINGPLSGGICLGRPFIWTPETGSKLLPVPSNTRSSRPNNMSDDGSTVVGWWETNPASFPPRRGARWVNGIFEEFSTPQLLVGEAVNVTPDGSTIVGGGALAPGGTSLKAWRWTRDGGVQLLGGVGPFGTPSAIGVSDNGKIVGGFAGNTALFPGDVSGAKAFLWTAELGFLDFEQFLRAQGTYFEGWILNSILSMSSDGTTLLGAGFGPRGGANWIIKLDKVHVCHAPPGKPEKAHTINVPFVDIMGEHLAHGDTVGVCTDSE